MPLCYNPPMFPPPLAMPLQLADRSRIALNFIADHGGLILCALFLLAGIAAAGDYGRGPDDPNQRQIARGNLDYILGRADTIATRIDIDRYYGAVFELPLLLAEQALGLSDPYYSHRLRLTLTHLFFIIGGYFCYLLAYRLFNNRLIALLALLFYLLHPRIYAHSFFNSKDPVFLSMFVIALYLLERAFRRDTPAAFVLLGLAVGVLTNLRIMGALLVFAVIAMRGLDLFCAKIGPERKDILRTAGLFILAAGLTLYAVTPYAWSNPVEYLTASLDLTVNRPGGWPQLFQGQWIPSDELPPHYNPTWFSITTPPSLLLLGGIGAALVAVAALRRPGALFRNTRRRFALLLLACFLLPPLTAALLGANQYNDWRHLYFVYGPFCLLAAGGLGGLVRAWSRRPLWRAGAYGLTGLGLALVLLQITQLHPLQSLYFNFLVDRNTPEYLRTRYFMESVNIGFGAALGYLLKQHPGETLTVRGINAGEWAALPPAARQRLRLPAGGRSADYELPYEHDPSQPDLAFNSVYPRRPYHNTSIILRPLDSARMTPAAVAAYREIYRLAVVGAPIIRADYNVYRHGPRLTFVKENCPPGGPDVRFAARTYPPPPPSINRETERPSSFANLRVRLDELCLAVLQLPDYIRGDLVISQTHLGRFRPTSRVWAELYNLDPPGLRGRIAELRQGRPPAAPNAFAVFLDQDAAGGYRLIYTKESCAAADYETPAFLHILPENRAVLPFYLWQSGVDNRELSLTRYGIRTGGECIAVVPLPDYPIKSLLTGQTGVWAKSLYPPPDPESLRAAAAALSDHQPAATSDFALYLQDNQLTYLRETCAATDTAANFFLHLTPRDTADSPAERPPAGDANLDFDFARYGGHFDGKCLAAVPLPDYPIAAIRTGQTDSWEVNLYPPADPDYLRAAAAALAEAQPVARADFDLYVRDNRLTYRRESCAAADTAGGFFLHIIPEDAADLPQERQDAGFANRDFAFARYGGHFDGQCLAVAPLPEYPIATIRTGQRNSGQGDGWSVELIAAPGHDRLRAAYAALSAADPAARSDFDLYRRDKELVYLRESCAAADTAANFFLHIIPMDVADLPAEQQSAGFANRDFAFARYGGSFDGKCLAIIPLPDYPVKAIRTGQYVAGQGEVWAVELTLAP